MSVKQVYKIRDEEAWSVASATESGKRHKTTLHDCDCKGFQYRGHCRHIDEVCSYIAGVKEPTLTELLEQSIKAVKARKK